LRDLREDPSLNQPSVIDHRGSERINVSWRAKLLLPKGEVIATRTFDISATGVGVWSEQPLMLKSTLQVALQVPTPNDLSTLEVVTGHALVVFQILRGHEYRVGLQWQALSAQTQKVLSAWTSPRRTPPAYQPPPGVIDL
jgi:c-di-GMP-binding flagellar brake protein YcgR